MNVLQSLITVGCLVRSGTRHGMVYSFNKTTNMVLVQFGSAGPHEEVHFAALRAGNDDSEEYVCGVVTKQYPKDPWPEVRESGQARALRHPRNEELWQ